MTKKQAFDIKKEIERKRKTINYLMNKRAKHLDDIAWIKSAFIKETLVLNQCPDKDIRFDTSSESIQNICTTWDTIVQRQNIVNITISDVMDIHCNMSHNTDVIPCQIRTKCVYNLATLIPAQQTPEIMRQRIDDILYKLNSGKQSILQRAFDAHYEFIILQPFNDFNKRTARMLMNWFLISKGYRPIAFTHTTDNKNYVGALKDARNGDKKSYYNYMYNCMSRSQDMFIDKLRHAR